MFRRFPKEWEPILKRDELLAIANDLKTFQSHLSLESRLSFYLYHYKTVTVETPHRSDSNTKVPESH